MSMNYTLKNLLLSPMNLLYTISPKLTLKILFRLKVGYPLNLEAPATYNEKLNWQKLYYKNDLFGVCADKYLVRQYVKDQGCGDILNTLLWSGFDPEEIPFDSLPDRFVIKTTHGSGFNIICKDKSKLDRAATVKQLKKWLKVKYIKCYGEHWYSEHKPRVIVESYLEDSNGRRLFDYKFFCFDGEPYYVYVDTWKDGKHHMNMYNADFTLRKEVSLGYPTDFSSDIKKPENYDDLLNTARKLSRGFPHVRIDLYDLSGRIVFGEMTFSKGAGLDRILPYEFDAEMGSHFKVRKAE